MPVKLFPQLRLLKPTLPVTGFPLTMRPGAWVQPSHRVIPVFSRVFPLRLRYSGGRALHLLRNENGELGVRRFSTRHLGKEARRASSSSKSLIEDEAELSDWVSDLRTDSFRGQLTSEDEASDVNRVRNRTRDRDSKGGRESNSMMNKRRRSKESFDESNRNSRVSRRFGSALEDNEGEGEGVSWRANGGFRSGNEMGRKGGREMDKGYERNRNVMGRREVDKGYVRDRNVNRGSDGLRKGVKDSIKQLRWMDDDVNVRSRNVNRGTEGLRKGVNNSMKQDLIKEPRWTNDEDGEKLLPTIGDLLSEEDSDSQDEEDDDDDDELLKKSASSMFGLDDEVSARVLPRPSSSKSDTQSYLSETRFDQCSVSPLSLKGIKDAGYEKMTVVQEATLPVILKGKDVLAKARTGTGKTVAFLLPSIEVVVKSPPIGRDQKWPPILVLVICPTRELASQAAAEANILLKYHPSIGVQVVIGGTRLALEQKRMQANPCQILVATPGRLRDHIENTAGFATRLMGVKVLVLDEADHLLDMGFRKDIEKIIAAVPKHRQTLLFSATVPEEVRQISHIALKRDHEFINTVQEGTEETHSQVRQMHLVAPLDKHFSLLYVLLKDHIADDVDYKVLVFCTTAMVTRLVADLLGELNLNVREIHSRKPQSYRTRISDEFRKSKGLILVTSDVSARGVDYPDVTLVIQVGLPSDREQYIHRLGRTGRKGKEGQGILLLAPWEEFFLSTIKDLPISKAPVHLIDPDTKKKVERALSQVEMKNKETAYQAWLGYYNSNKKVGRDKHRLVELANEFSRSMGLDNPPAIPKLVLGKMGLRNISGLRSK
ncbi:DEAD-box ATP-dependent RNA helicase 31-like [Quercus robur]|uniref:DEAD-box ATP-dependent RNA helicase 31-like n=1 Tax=Quercus robur TaxID=38942 RepID=UPI00216161BF|nr:DEAD-box ATP-dependent RNA helicase 31-like [Quercus robur]